MDDHLQVAERLFAAITRGDVDGVRAVYAPQCVVWHNNDGVEQSVDENLRVLSWVIRNLRELRYDDVRRQTTPTGFVQQHVLRAVGAGGKPIEIPACIVCRVENGRITRLDEYLDSAQVAAMLA